MRNVAIFFTNNECMNVIHLNNCNIIRSFKINKVIEIDVKKPKKEYETIIKINTNNDCKKIVKEKTNAKVKRFIIIRVEKYSNCLEVLVKEI